MKDVMNLFDLAKLYYGAPYFAMVFITVLLVLVLLCGWKAPRWAKAVGSVVLAYTFADFYFATARSFYDFSMQGDIAPMYVASEFTRDAIPLIYGLLVYAVARIICMIQTKTWLRSAGTITLVLCISLSLFILISYMSVKCWTIDDDKDAFMNILIMVREAFKKSLLPMFIGTGVYAVSRIVGIFKTARI